MRMSELRCFIATKLIYEDLNLLLVCNHVVMEPVKGLMLCLSVIIFGILARRRPLVIVIPVKIDQQNAQNVRIWYDHTI